MVQIHKTRRINAFRLAVSIAILPVIANAAESKPQCEALYHSPTGRIADASYSALHYSEEQIGAVGIALFPGLDLPDFDPHEVGLKLVQIFSQNGVVAACFVNHAKTRSDTSISYKINGVTWQEDNGNLKPAEAQDEETIRAVAMEAKMVKKLLGKKQP